MNYLKINNTDISNLISGLKIGYETLVNDETSGRNANGDMMVDIINKKTKLYLTLPYLFEEDMTKFLTLIQNYVINVEYRDPITHNLKTIKCYTGTPEPEYYCILDNKIIYKPMNINFIQL